MKCFDVWVRPMDYEYRVTVDGASNADWLLTELGRSFVFKTDVPLVRTADSPICSFQVPFASLLPFALFRRLLAAIPEVNLVMLPAMG